MGEWKRQGETVCMPNTVHCAMAADGEEARFITTTHNADCDAYEARIAALEAELASVKAASLRVVEDGEVPAQSIPMSAHFEYGGVVYRMFGGDIDKDEMKGTDILTSKKIVLSCKTSVRSVRLERWEDEG